MSGPDAGFYAGLARKRSAAGALITDTLGRILIVEPAYKSTWEVPGGVVEDGETAPAACARELREEIGLVRTIGRLLVVEHQTDRGVRGDSVMFVYDGGILSDPEGIRLDESELKSFGFFARDELATHMAAKVARRLGYAADALAAGIVIELEDGIRRV